jgi:hypothetical protein
MMVAVAPGALLSTHTGIALIRCSTHELRTVIPGIPRRGGWGCAARSPVGLNGQYLLQTLRRTSD